MQMKIPHMIVFATTAHSGDDDSEQPSRGQAYQLQRSTSMPPLRHHRRIRSEPFHVGTDHGSTFVFEDDDDDNDDSEDDELMHSGRGSGVRFGCAHSFASRRSSLRRPSLDHDEQTALPSKGIKGMVIQTSRRSLRSSSNAAEAAVVFSHGQLHTAAIRPPSFYAPPTADPYQSYYYHLQDHNHIMQGNNYMYRMNNSSSSSATGGGSHMLRWADVSDDSGSLAPSVPGSVVDNKTTVTANTTSSTSAESSTRLSSSEPRRTRRSLLADDPPAAEEEEPEQEEERNHQEPQKLHSTQPNHRSRTPTVTGTNNSSGASTKCVTNTTSAKLRRKKRMDRRASTGGSVGAILNLSPPPITAGLVQRKLFGFGIGGRSARHLLQNNNVIKPKTMAKSARAPTKK